MKPAITLLTDFGIDTHYVAQMKGGILSVSPDATLVDVTHSIPPQDIRTGGWVLDQSIDAFPRGTIHVAVVDPGVGSERAILAAKTDAGYFVAPDNGLLTRVFDRYPPVELIHVLNDGFWRTCVSSTFHGRDVMAPVAAHLSQGIDLQEFGSPTKVYCRHSAVAVHSTELGLQGEVLYVDSFGNLITNIERADVERLDPISNEQAPSSRWSVAIEVPDGRLNVPLVNCYADAEAGSVNALFGSSNLLEIAVSGGRAARECSAGAGVRVWLSTKSTRIRTES